MVKKNKGSRLGKQPNRTYDLIDLESGEVSFKLWELQDPEKTYNANLCETFVQGPEFIVVFGQSPPTVRRAMNAVAISMPLSNLPNLLKGFEQIQDRLEKQKFKARDMGRCALPKRQLRKLKEKSFVRFSAQIVRSACGDDLAVLDFYEQPITPAELVRAQPHKKVEISPVIRVTCTAILLSYFLKSASAEIGLEKGSDNDANTL